MKRKFSILFLLVSMLADYLYSVALGIGIYTGTIKEPMLGFIVIPVGGLLVVAIFLVISKFIFGNKIVYKLKSWKKYKSEIIIIAIPVILTIIANVATSISLDILFNKLPVGQIVASVIYTFIAAVAIGFIEETICRGGMFNAVASLFDHTKYQLLLASVISSIIFGCSHLLNLIDGADLVYTLYQVIYASAIGFCFSIVSFMTGSLLIPIIAHALVDWSDFFFNISGQPDVQEIWYVLIILIIVYLVTAIVLYNRYTKTLQIEVNN